MKGETRLKVRRNGNATRSNSTKAKDKGGYVTLLNTNMYGKGYEYDIYSKGESSAKAKAQLTVSAK